MTKHSKKGFAVQGVATTRMETSIANTATRKLFNKTKQDRWVLKRIFTYEYLIDCQLYRGEDKYPRSKKMTISQLGKENRVYRNNFISRLDRGDTKSKLWYWKMHDYIFVQEDRVKFYKMFLGKPHIKDGREGVEYIRKLNQKNFSRGNK